MSSTSRGRPIGTLCMWSHAQWLCSSPGVQVVGEDHPAGSAGQAIGHLRELRAPHLVSAEPLGEEFHGVPARPAIATQVVEVVLVEDYGSGAHEFLALQISVDVWRQVFFRQEHG